MDILSIILAIGAIILVGVLIWAIVAIIAIRSFRETSRDLTKDIVRGSGFDHFNRR